MIEKYLPRKWQKRVVFVHGGKTRIASYDNAVKYLTDASVVYDIVITQDAARPCTQSSVIPRLISRFRQTPGNAVCITGASLTESLFIKQGIGLGLQGIDRAQYLLGRTPYIFDPIALQAALECWRKKSQGKEVSETADILEFLHLRRGQKIEVLETDEPNPKLTVLEDVDIIRRCLKKFR
jgi:2-C-methyl-D-erythritol 4-phosphate cytidylyltransferase